MKFSLVCVTLALVIAVASAKSAKHHQKWASYKKNHNKTFKSPEEENIRASIFLAADNDINAHNEKFALGETTYIKAHNKFSDKTSEEKNRLNGARNLDAFPVVVRGRRDVNTATCFRFNLSCPCFYNFTVDSTLVVPTTVDLRTTGWSEAVRDQGQCGSCWAFSSSSVMSFYQYNKTKSNLVFAPQNLVDCDYIWGAGGCNGASPAQAMEYFQKNMHTLESVYPYKGVQNACTRSTTQLYSITGFFQVSINWPSQAALEQALYKRGAIVVSIDANGLFSYKSGVWDGSYVVNSVTKYCNPNAPNHAVVLIGFGVDSVSGKKYWLIKNSWGTGWGEAGFFRMLRDNTNKCGILSYAYGVF